MSRGTPRNISPAAVAAWKAPAAPPGVGTSEPTSDQPRTKTVSVTPKRSPKARSTSKFANTIDSQTMADQPTVTASSRAFTSTLSALASCSRILTTARVNLAGMKRRRSNVPLIQLIALCDFFLNCVRPNTPSNATNNRMIPIIRTRPNSTPAFAGGLNHRRFTANKTTTAIMS